MTNLHLTLGAGLLNRSLHVQHARHKHDGIEMDSDIEKLPQNDKKSRIPHMSCKTSDFHELWVITTSSSDGSKQNLALKTMEKGIVDDFEQPQSLFNLSTNLLRYTNITCRHTTVQALQHSRTRWVIEIDCWGSVYYSRHDKQHPKRHVKSQVSQAFD